MEAERVVFERSAVVIAHQKPHEPRIRLVHFLLPPRERDAGGVHHREVGGHGVVEPDEAVVEDANGLFG